MTKKQLHHIARERSRDVLKWLRFKTRHRRFVELYDATMAQLETIPFGSLELACPELPPVPRKGNL